MISIKRYIDASNRRAALVKKFVINIYKKHEKLHSRGRNLSH